MPRPLKSQWNFGELFPPEATRRVFTVSELTLTVRRLIEGQVGRVWVGGEVTNFRLQTSGHAYFGIKDASAQLSCVLFRDEARSIQRDLLSDGQKVVLQGEMTVYEARGQYQLRVTAVELQGLGALQAAFERLKQKLNSEGLFAPERKRMLPRYPQCLGVVTSPTGAALCDVLHVIERRYPGLQVILAPCRVQGQGAADEIARAIGLLNEWNALKRVEPRRNESGAGLPIDLILVTRGGGSLEDLWAFNEEVVARTISESALPVVSAVGHEIDFTISDFVADVRAATPSAAAEIITEGMFASRQFVEEAGNTLRYLAKRRIGIEREELHHLFGRMSRAHPRRVLRERSQRVDDLQTSLAQCAHFGCRAHRSHLHELRQRLLRLKPGQWLARRREEVVRLCCALHENARVRVLEARARLVKAVTQLRLLSPDNVLERGYSITRDAATGGVIRASAEVRSGQRLKTTVRDGEIVSTVQGPFDAK